MPPVVGAATSCTPWGRKWSAMRRQRRSVYGGCSSRRSVSTYRGEWRPDVSRKWPSRTAPPWRSSCWTASATVLGRLLTGEGDGVVGGQPHLRQRPVGEQRLADYGLFLDGADNPRVAAVVAMVAQHEVRPGRHFPGPARAAGAARDVGLYQWLFVHEDDAAAALGGVAGDADDP